jgi:hypothetical protein
MIQSIPLAVAVSRVLPVHPADISVRTLIVVGAVLGYCWVMLDLWRSGRHK